MKKLIEEKAEKYKDALTENQFFVLKCDLEAMYNKGKIAGIERARAIVKETK